MRRKEITEPVDRVEQLRRRRKAIRKKAVIRRNIIIVLCVMVALAGVIFFSVRFAKGKRSIAETSGKNTAKSGDLSTGADAGENAGNGKNSGRKVELNVIKDDEPPVIEGVREITAAVGSSVSYKRGITVRDNVDPKPKLTVDDGEADLRRTGSYVIIYKAKDMSGNESFAKTMLHVVTAEALADPEKNAAKEAELNAAADNILQTLGTARMSQMDAARTIFNWINKKIMWVEEIPMDSWVDAAYSGIVKRRGDCYVFASVAKCLLTKAGIPNMDIHGTRERNTHYWNLINIGEGWRHFDATRWADKAELFYYTDEQIKPFSDAHDGSHEYDRSLYPSCS